MRVVPESGGSNDQRVHELLVEPEVHKDLGQYVLLLHHGVDQVRAVGCDPELAYAGVNADRR